MTLNEINPGHECSVIDVLVNGVLGQRLLDMGFVPGTRIQVIRNAPLVDPVEIRIKGYLLSLRHVEAKAIKITPV